MRFLRWAIAATALILCAGTPIQNSLIVLANNTVMGNTSVQAGLAGAGYIIRAGYATIGDSPELKYTGSLTPCVLNGGAGDGAVQIPAKDGCWNRFPQAVNDVSSWGFSNTAAQDFYLSTTGSDHGGLNHCLVSADPCLTVANAILHVASMINKGVDTYIMFQDTGPYVVSELSGRPLGGLTTYTTSSGTNGPRLWLYGNSGSPTVLTQGTGSAPAIYATSYLNLAIHNVTVSVTQAGGIGIFVQNHAYVNANGGVTVTSQLASVTGLDAIHTEGNAYFEWQNSLTLDGAWSQNGFDGDEVGYFEADPTASVTCGTHYSQGNALVRLTDSHYNDAIVTMTYTGCPATGIGIQANEHSTWTRSAAAQAIPGGTYKVNSPDTIYQPNEFQASVTSCTNGTLETNSSNYVGSVTFTGNASTCTITFGKPSALTSYFSATPSCIALGSVAVTDGGTNVSVFIVNGTFVNGSHFKYICLPIKGG